MNMSHLVRVTRGSIDESWHDAAVVVTHADGRRLAHAGEIDFVTFARSSCKPIQAIPTVEAGALARYRLDLADLALFCASHSSEHIHTDRVQSILDRIGLDASLLVCGPHPPHSHETYEEIIRKGGELTAIHSNCSGKHAGMLTYCAATGSDPATYADVSHPLQQKILTTLAELAEVPQGDIILGVDGCGVPVHAIPLAAWGRAFAKFVRNGEAHGPAMREILKAMGSHPELVGGTKDRFDTDLMRATSGRIVAKGGAEGFLMIIDTAQRASVVIKVRDGNSRAIPPIALRVLLSLDALTPTERTQLAPYERPIVRNTQGREVGEIIADFELVRA
ncbi:L-asparaginase II [Alicyclobacillus hesperidum URH17-3-68]|nr:asparaginase [Alicyclobacillus hesperidum]EJY56704.1 L-asparaginase II [Alicyclobacillus hesperidum URH17-3-68]